jgi:hypothetical protein
MRGTTKSNPAGLHFSGHETFPLRQMWLKKAFDRADAKGRIAKAVFSDDSAIADFGVGRNMVSSILHWALACDVLREDEEEEDYVVTDTAMRIFTTSADGSSRKQGCDPYSEHAATAWYVHWCLAGRGTRATTWNWLFNHLTSPTFTRDEAATALLDYARRHSPARRLSASTLSRDLETCIRGYVPRSDGESVEAVAEPVLGELGLLREERKGLFSFRRGPKSTLPDALFAWALMDYWERAAPKESSMAFEGIAYGVGSPGRVFKLDEDSISERLVRLDAVTKHKLRWTDTAGMRQVHRENEAAFRSKPSLLEKSYD